jgi:hypothetical protein
MRVVTASDSGATIEFSRAELVLLANALNETLEAVDAEEFDTRVGSSTGDAVSLQEQLLAHLRAGAAD